jgi:hypothetical protein
VKKAQVLAFKLRQVTMFFGHESRRIPFFLEMWGSGLVGLELSAPLRRLSILVFMMGRMLEYRADTVSLTDTLRDVNQQFKVEPQLLGECILSVCHTRTP